MMKKEKEERMKQLDRELEEAVDGEVIQLSPNVIQARMLLCIIRAGAVALVRPATSKTVSIESAMFRLIGSAYIEQSLGLRDMLKRFDHTVQERMAALAEGTLRDQLVEILGEDLMDALTDLGKGE